MQLAAPADEPNRADRDTARISEGRERVRRNLPHHVESRPRRDRKREQAEDLVLRVPDVLQEDGRAEDQTRDGVYERRDDAVEDHFEAEATNAWLASEETASQFTKPALRSTSTNSSP